MEDLIATLLRDFEQGRLTRRQLVQTLALAATATAPTRGAAAADTPVAKALSINHVSYQVADYRRSRCDLLAPDVHDYRD